MFDQLAIALSNIDEDLVLDTKNTESGVAALVATSQQQGTPLSYLPRTVAVRSRPPSEWTRHWQLARTPRISAVSLEPGRQDDRCDKPGRAKTPTSPCYRNPRSKNQSLSKLSWPAGDSKILGKTKDSYALPYGPTEVPSVNLCSA